MLDPVVASDGSTYSREGIVHWLETAGAGGKAVRSPLTGEVVTTSLVPNHMLRGLVLDWVEKAKKEAAAAAAHALPEASAPPARA